MNAREYCINFLKMQAEADRRRRSLDRIRKDRQRISLLRSPTYDGAPTRSGTWNGGVYNLIEEQADRVMNAELEYLCFLADYIRQTRTLERQIEQIETGDYDRNHKYKVFLILRFIMGLTVEQTAARMKFCYNHAAQLAEPAYNALQAVLDQEEADAGGQPYSLLAEETASED